MDEIKYKEEDLDKNPRNEFIYDKGQYFPYQEAKEILLALHNYYDQSDNDNIITCLADLEEIVTHIPKTPGEEINQTSITEILDFLEEENLFELIFLLLDVKGRPQIIELALLIFNIIYRIESDHTIFESQCINFEFIAILANIAENPQIINSEKLIPEYQIEVIRKLSLESIVNIIKVQGEKANIFFENELIDNLISGYYICFGENKENMIVCMNVIIEWSETVENLEFLIDFFDEVILKDDTPLYPLLQGLQVIVQHKPEHRQSSYAERIYNKIFPRIVELCAVCDVDIRSSIILILKEIFIRADLEIRKRCIEYLDWNVIFNFANFGTSDSDDLTIIGIHSVGIICQSNMNLLSYLIEGGILDIIKNTITDGNFNMKSVAMESLRTIVLGCDDVILPYFISDSTLMDGVFDFIDEDNDSDTACAFDIIYEFASRSSDFGCSEVLQGYFNESFFTSIDEGINSGGYLENISIKLKNLICGEGDIDMMDLEL